MPNVIVTSISKKVPLIEAVRNAMKKTHSKGVLHGCDKDVNAIGRYFVDFFWQPPAMDEKSFELFRDYCVHHRITAIIPTRDGELEFFAAHCAEFEKKGIQVMVSSAETIQTCLDKKLFADRLEKHRYCSIPTFDAIDDVRTTSVYVVKDRFGAGSNSLGIKLSKEAALKHGAKLKSPIFQPFIEGREYSIDLYRSKAGTVQGCVVRSRDLIVSGESQVTTTVKKPSLEKLCSQIAVELNLYGHAVFQAIESTDGVFHIIECNPRFGGASTASFAVGLDSFFWFLLESQGQSLNSCPFQRSRHEIRQVRYPCDRIMELK